MSIVLACLVALLVAAPVAAAEIRLLTTGAFKPVALALIPRFEAETGHTVIVENDTAGGLIRRIGAGAAFDVVVLTPGAIRDLALQGKVAGGPVDLARVGIGVAVRAGAPRPEIGSVEAFKRMLLDARSVAYIDPRAGGSSGIYLAALFQRLGVAEQVGSKAVLVPGGLVAERVTNGDAQVGIHQISELLAVKGAEFVGPLPAEIQSYTGYTGGVGASTREPAAASALLATFSGPAAAAVLQDKGMLPPALRAQ